MSTRKVQAVMFDLDGTLLDSLADLANATNHALEAIGCPTHPVTAYKPMVGDGARMLCQRALPRAEHHRLEQVLAIMRAHYAAHGTDLTQPYKGIEPLLDDLARAGQFLAVLSNKPDDATVRLVHHYFGPGRFQVVRGHRPPRPLKPDPAAARDIVAESNVPARHWLYLGDTDTDMRTARAAGLTAVGVLWGFREADELEKAGAQHLAATPAEILQLL